MATTYNTAAGIDLRIMFAAITADDRIAVTYTIADPAGLPLDRAGVLTVGAFNPSFVLAAHDVATDRYLSLVTREETAASGTIAIQATGENSGNTTELSVGAYRYESNVRLPAGFDRDTTIRVGMYGSRPFEGESHVGNAIHDFTPSGAATTLRELVAVESCNACHGQLEAHGGARRDPRLCMECHSPLTTDAESGNVLDFPVMVHRIHRGVELPSVAEGEVGAEYAISGFQDNITVYARRFGPEPEDVTGVRYPQDLRRCTTCHGAAVQGDRVDDIVTRAACTTCHDNVSFLQIVPPGMEPHPGAPQDDDLACDLCHGPAAFASTEQAHLTDEQFLAEQGLLAGLQLSIESVTSVAPGSQPAITFGISDEAGAPLPLASLSRIAATVAGPHEEPLWTIPGESLAAATDNGDGTFTATIAGTLPADLSPEEAIAVGLEGRRTVTADRNGTPVTFNEGAFNPLAHVNADGSDSVAPPPEPAVEQAKCDACHDRLRAHGNLRQNVGYCRLCHIDTFTDAATRPPEAGEPESIALRVMIHKIHRGEELAQPYVVYDRNGAPVALDEVRFPGALDRCETCHVGELWKDPSVDVCTSCHDDPDSEAHAELNTTSSGRESCGVCHGEGSEFAVDAVHTPAP